jgi:peptidoglycan/xylan/chitin deacetylase (PgdA/CDA1 family)
MALISAGVAVLRLNFFCRSVCRGKTGARQAALTFDDGPDLETTPAVLAVLARYGLKAAFFCVGENVLQNPELARRIVGEGHIIANHSHHHDWWMNFLRFKGLNREMAQTQAVIKNATGKLPAFYRPLAGLTNPHIGKALRHNGLTCVGWDVRPFDTVRKKDGVVDTVLHKTRDGSVILLHDTGRTAQDMTELLDAVIKGLMARGFTLSPLENLLGLEPYQGGALDETSRQNREANHPAPLGWRRLVQWLERKEAVRKALADRVTFADIKQRPSVRFMAGISLVGFSYIIGWPAVAFFAFLAVYLDVKELALLGPASYIVSHVVFFAGAALAGVDGIKYGRLYFRFIMHRFARWVQKKALFKG